MFLGWVAFTSVNVVFKDHIIATKDRRYHQMQASYETRVSDLQLAYDELNNALVTAEDHFKARAERSEKPKQPHALRANPAQAGAAAAANNGAIVARTRLLRRATTDCRRMRSPCLRQRQLDIPSACEDECRCFFRATSRQQDACSERRRQSDTQGRAHRPRRGRNRKRRKSHSPATLPSRASFLEGAVEKLASVFGRNRAPSAAILDHPALRQIAIETNPPRTSSKPPSRR